MGLHSRALQEVVENYVQRNFVTCIDYSR